MQGRSIDFRFSIFDFRGDPTDKCGGLRIFDFRFWIDSTDKSGGLYHQEILGQKASFCLDSLLPNSTF
ncbi:hypothetical protein D0A34_03610 [Microcoleus vaginatus PCC 9802]|nr:hypothetical protein D0A34_03610 [Microcoleus vaginatus PCC 9802]